MRGIVTQLNYQSMYTKLKRKNKTISEKIVCKGYGYPTCNFCIFCWKD